MDAFGVLAKDAFRVQQKHNSLEHFIIKIQLLFQIKEEDAVQMYTILSSTPAEGVHHLLIGNQAVVDFSCFSTHPINLTAELLHY